MSDPVKSVPCTMHIHYEPTPTFMGMSRFAIEASFEKQSLVAEFELLVDDLELESVTTGEPVGDLIEAEVAAHAEAFGREVFRFLFDQLHEERNANPKGQ